MASDLWRLNLADLEVLGLDPKVPLSADALKQAYRRAANRWHPDHNRGREKEATERFIKAKQAYEKLQGALEGGWNGVMSASPPRPSANTSSSQFSAYYRPPSSPRPASSPFSPPVGSPRSSVNSEKKEGSGKKSSSREEDKTANHPKSPPRPNHWRQQGRPRPFNHHRKEETGPAARDRATENVEQAGTAAFRAWLASERGRGRAGEVSGQTVIKMRGDMTGVVFSATLLPVLLLLATFFIWLKFGDTPSYYNYLFRVVHFALHSLLWSTLATTIAGSLLLGLTRALHYELSDRFFAIEIRVFNKKLWRRAVPLDCVRSYKRLRLMYWSVFTIEAYLGFGKTGQTLLFFLRKDESELLERLLGAGHQR